MELTEAVDGNDLIEMMDEAMSEFFNEEKEKNNRRKQQLPIKKAKFLKAIRKSTETLDEELDSNEDNSSVFNMFRYCTNLTWKDSEVTDRFMDWKEPEFIFSVYLDSVKYILLVYFGRIDIDKELVLKAMMYVLSHARDFTDPTKRLLKFSEKEEATSNELAAPTLPELAATLPDTPYAAAMSECLNRLHLSSLIDDEAYHQLNANITYLILLMVRRSVKTENEFLKSLILPKCTDLYIKLCPHPINNQLPVISEQLNRELRGMLRSSAVIYLVLTALLQCEDERTKQVLNVTCLQHLEWTGLVFPKLFFQVAKLYDVSEGDFWDMLSTDKTFDSLIELSDIYYKQYKNATEDPTASFKLFPYARAVNIDYNTDLSPRSHGAICYTLAYLHDLHFGLDKSFARKAYWTKTIKPNSPVDHLAMVIYNQLRKEI